MILNRKSAKKTSRISLLIAITMITTIFGALQTQSYHMDFLAETGINVCQAGLVDVVSALFW